MDAFGPGKQSGMFGNRGGDIRFQTPLSSQNGNESYHRDNRPSGHNRRQVRFNESGPQIRLYSKQGNGYEDFFQDSDRDAFLRGPKFQGSFGRNYSGGQGLEAGFGAKPSPYTQTHSPEEIRYHPHWASVCWGRGSVDLPTEAASLCFKLLSLCTWWKPTPHMHARCWLLSTTQVKAHMDN